MSIIIYIWLICFALGKALIPVFGWENLMGTAHQLPEFLSTNTLLAQCLRQMFNPEPVNLVLIIASTILCLRLSCIGSHVSKLFVSSTLLSAIASHYLHQPALGSSSFIAGLLTLVLLVKNQEQNKTTAIISLATTLLLTPHLHWLALASGALPSLVGAVISKRSAISSIHSLFSAPTRVQIPSQSSSRPIFRDCEVIDFERRKAS